MKDDLRKPWYLGGTAYDLLFIVMAPLLACVIVGALLPNRATSQTWLWPDVYDHWLPFWALVLTMLHVNIGFARSHLNKQVFQRHKYRFVLIPVVVAVVLSSSSAVLAFVAVIALFWDELHSAFQTFGFGRLYDSRLGNDPEVGRRLDRWFCVVIEWVPHVLLVAYMTETELHRADLEQYPPYLVGVTSKVAQVVYWPLLVGSLAYVAYYFYRYIGFVRDGYRISWPKIALYASTFTAAIYAVTCHTLVGIAVLTNIYHAVQYVAIVWLTERNNLRSRLSLESFKYGAATTALILLGVSGGVAYVRASGAGMSWLAGIWLTLTLMHYWFDSFIWSVRRAEVQA